MQEMQETGFWSLVQEDHLEEEMATHSSILAWKFPWAEQSGGLQSMGSQRLWHDWATKHAPMLSVAVSDGSVLLLNHFKIFILTTY